MKTLVLVEHDNTKVNDATLAVVTAASKLGEVHLLVAGSGCKSVADEAAKITAPVVKFLKRHGMDATVDVNDLASGLWEPIR